MIHSVDPKLTMLTLHTPRAAQTGKRHQGKDRAALGPNRQDWP